MIDDQPYCVLCDAVHHRMRPGKDTERRGSSVVLAVLGRVPTPGEAQATDDRDICSGPHAC